MSDQARLDRLQARIAVLQDCEDIEALKARYWRALDRRRPDDVQDCLTPDAVVDFEGLPRYEGRDAFMALVRNAAVAPRHFDMHHGHNPRITLTGADTAEGEWEIFYFGIDAAAGTLVQMAGVYTDTYRRTHDRWLIAATTMRTTSMCVQSAAVGAAPASVMFGRAG